MGLVVPDVLEQEVLTTILTPDFTIKLYSNDYTPVAASATANFIEVVGGGYASKPLVFANWGIVPGNPTTALYNASQEWTFTGPTNAPATIYGIFVTRNNDGKLMWAERFAVGFLPFTPIAGSIIRYLPKFTGQSEF